MELIEFLKTIFNQGWVGSLIGVISLITAYILYRASRIGPRPVFQYRSINLIEKEKQALPTDVEIYFGGKKVSRLTKTFIIFWNSGKSTLYGKDIVKDDPLRFSFGKDAEILRARIPKITKKMNKFEARINPNLPNEVIINFDYLDPNDGGIIEILHTSNQRIPECKGTIRGVPKGVLNWGRLPYESVLYEKYFPLLRRYMPRKIFLSIVPIVWKIFLSMVSIIGLGMIIAGFLSRTNGDLVIAGLFYFIFPAAQLWIYRRRYPKSLSIEDVE